MIGRRARHHCKCTEYAMNEQPAAAGPTAWTFVRDKLDQSLPFATCRHAVLPHCIGSIFGGEYKRRYDSLRAKMREHKLDAVVSGGPTIGASAPA